MKITQFTPLFKWYYKNPERNVVNWKLGSHWEYSELFNGSNVVTFFIPKNINKQVQAVILLIFIISEHSIFSNNIVYLSGFKLDIFYPFEQDYFTLCEFKLLLVTEHLFVVYPVRICKKCIKSFKINKKKWCILLT